MIFNLSNSYSASLIIGVEPTVTQSKLDEIKRELERIPRINRIVFVPGLKGAYCITV